VAVCAGHVEFAFSGGHVYIERVVGLQERVVKVAVFYGVCSTSLKMAASAVVPVGVLDMLRNVGKVDFFVGFFLLGCGLIGRMSCACGEFLVGSCSVVAGKAVDIFLTCEVKFFVFPPIPYMA